MVTFAPSMSTFPFLVFQRPSKNEKRIFLLHAKSLQGFPPWGDLTGTHRTQNTNQPFTGADSVTPLARRVCISTMLTRGPCVLTSAHTSLISVERQVCSSTMLTRRPCVLTSAYTSLISVERQAYTCQTCIRTAVITF